jgi:hypothetical protein
MIIKYKAVTQYNVMVEAHRDKSPKESSAASVRLWFLRSSTT